MIPGKEGQFYPVGEGVQPWKSTAGGEPITISTLPGRNAEYISRQLSEAELASLSKHFEGVEFGMTSHLTTKGERVYQVFSERAGELGRAPVPFSNIRGFRLEAHTHPSGTPYASGVDLDTLKALNQQSSLVVLPDGSVFRYTQTNPNTLLPSPRTGETLPQMLNRPPYKRP